MYFGLVLKKLSTNCSLNAKKRLIYILYGELIACPTINPPHKTHRDAFFTKYFFYPFLSCGAIVPRRIWIVKQETKFLGLSEENRMNYLDLTATINIPSFNNLFDKTARAC